MKRATATTRRGIPLLLWVLLLAVIFLALPLILYRLLEAADADKRDLLLTSVRERGRLAMELLRPVLQEDADLALFEAKDHMALLTAQDTVLRLFFRPQGSAETSFFYVATNPEIGGEALLAERAELLELGVFDRLSAACDAGAPVLARHQLGNVRGEVISAVTPLNTPDGCWTLVTAMSTAAYRDSSIGRPYWETPEIRLGALAYVASLIVAVAVFWLIWRSLRQLTRQAREIRLSGHAGGNFTSGLGPREFVEVGRELDRLVGALDTSVRLIREAAVENAHAFKRPVAIIRQSLEPLRRRTEDARQARAIEVSDQALDRLESLITAAWRVDEQVTSLLQPRHSHLDVSGQISRLAAGYAKMGETQHIRLVADIMPGVHLYAAADLVDGIAVNLLDNALSFTPPGGQINIHLHGGADEVVLSVLDSGPGVPAEDLGKIFERYYSARRHQSGEVGHLGLGLWLVKRNTEALGGEVRAANRPDGGLEVSVVFPVSGATG